MIKRELYLEKIRGFYKETSLIKIIYGLRRSGKSVILTQIIEELKEQGVNNEKTIEREFGAYDVINDNISQLIILRMIGVDGFARGTKNFMEWSFINDCTS